MLILINMISNNYGLNNTYSYYEYELDSLDALGSASGSSSRTDWPSFNLRELSDIAAMKILEVQIPFSWYVFNSLNNTFVLTENGGAPLTVTIPIGNYNTTSLANTLEAALEAVSAFDYTVTYSGSSTTDPMTGKFTITNDNIGGSFTLTFGPLNDPGFYNPRVFLGFNSGPNVSTLVATIPTLVAPRVANVTGPNYLFVNSFKHGQDCDLFLNQQLGPIGQQGPEFAKIPVNVQPGGVIYWQDPDPQKWFDFDNIPNFSQIDFYLTLGNGFPQVPLQLNGLSFSLKLGVLTTKRSHNQLVGSGAQNYRVERRNIS